MNTEQMREALDRMDALLDSEAGLLTVPAGSATHTAAVADMRTIRAALTHPQEPARVGGVPEDWKLMRKKAGITVQAPNGDAVYVEPHARASREMPEEVLYALADALLAATHPKEQP